MGPDQNKDCPICRKHLLNAKNNKSFIYENEHIVVSHAQLFGDEKDHYLGHAFVETQRHVGNIGELTKEESEAIGRFVSLTAMALTVTLGFEHIYTFVFGDHVPHLHVHVIGRYPQTPREYWGTKVDEWPDAPRGNDEQINKLAGKLREYFRQLI